MSLFDIGISGISDGSEGIYSVYTFRQLVSSRIKRQVDIVACVDDVGFYFVRRVNVFMFHRSVILKKD